jgi:hypothetical protein
MSWLSNLRVFLTAVLSGYCLGDAFMRPSVWTLIIGLIAGTTMGIQLLDEWRRWSFMR